MSNEADNFVSAVQNDMRGDAGIGNNEQQIEQITWILFLKAYYSKEQQWKIKSELKGIPYHSIIPEKYQWNHWAKNTKYALRNGDLISFVDTKLIPCLKNLDKKHPHLPHYQEIVPEVFAHINNHMQNGHLLRLVINDVDRLDISNTKEHDVIASIYEEILRKMQSQSNSGEYYTPRPLTNFVDSLLHIKLGDSIGDFAVGTGGFLTSALDILYPQISSGHDFDLYSNSVHGRELHFLPFLLCVTNLFLHNIDNPHISHGDSLDTDVSSFKDDEKFDVIAMNPPYGQNKNENDLKHFPPDYQSNELSDLFIVLAMYRLKEHGHAGIVVPDSFMFGNSPVKQKIKRRLFSKFNVKLIIRLPKGVFNPYTSINTNLVFFDNTTPTSKTWFYRIDVPKGMKQYTKTRPISNQSFKGVKEWLKHPQEIKNKSDKKAELVPVEQIKKRKYDLSYVGFGQKYIVTKSISTLMHQYKAQKKQDDKTINDLYGEVEDIIRSIHNGKN